MHAELHMHHGVVIAELTTCEVGDFTKFESQAVADFIRESNKGRACFFVATRQEALERLAPAAR